MAQPYVGEIRLMANTFAPAGWMDCAGQTLPISENDVLFQVIGTTYGGDGQETFQLPDLQGRVPIFWGNGFQLAERGGTEEVTLSRNEMPIHSHPLIGSANTANAATTANNLLATIPLSAGQFAYGTVTPILPLDGSSISPAGGGQPHDNMQPYGVVRYIISLFGLFPSQT